MKKDDPNNPVNILRKQWQDAGYETDDGSFDRAKAVLASHSHRDLRIVRFLSMAVAHTERKFWIDRTYRALTHCRIVPGLISVPRALTKTPLLGVIARYWEYETTKHCSPTCEEVKQFYDEEMGNETT